MKQFFGILIIFMTNVCMAQSHDMQTGLKEIGSACDNYKEQKDYPHHFCDMYKGVKKTVSEKGQQFSDMVMEVVPFADSLAMTGFIVKALVDQKIEIDPRMSEYGRPRLEIKPQEVSLKVSVDW